MLFCTRFSVFLFFVFLHFFVAGVRYWYYQISKVSGYPPERLESEGSDNCEKV